MMQTIVLKAPLNNVLYRKSSKDFQETTKSIWISINYAWMQTRFNSLVWEADDSRLFKGPNATIVTHLRCSPLLSFRTQWNFFPRRLGGQISYGHSYKNHLKRLRINQFTNQSVTSNSYSSKKISKWKSYFWWVFDCATWSIEITFSLQILGFVGLPSRRRLCPRFSSRRGSLWRFSRRFPPFGRQRVQQKSNHQRNYYP